MAMADRLRMLGVRMAMLQERSPIWTFLVPVVAMTAGFGVITAVTPSGSAAVIKGLIGGAGWGVAIGIVMLIMRRRKPPVLAGLDARTRFTVGRIVAKGGPVPGEYASLVVRHADEFLQLPYHPVVSSIIFGSSAVATGWSLAFAIDDGDGARIVWAAVIVVSLISLLVITVRRKGRRQRAAAARAQALQLLGWGAG